ncbi:MAG: DUF3305 domain-containing protein [Pseudomonadota bacterium]
MAQADGQTDGIAAREATIMVGVVIRRQPGVTKWAKWFWRPVAVLPGAPEASWHEMRRDGDAIEYHAATVPLTVHRKETEGYLVALSNAPPSVYVILRPNEDQGSPHDVEVFGVTASAFEAQDYMDSGEEQVEAVPMPPELVGWISAFVGQHHVDEAFVKRKRRRWDAAPDQIGQADPRVPAGGIFRAPTGRKQ